MKNPFTPLGKRGRARRINDRAGELRDAGKKAEAIACYQRAMAIDPSWSVPFFDLALLHKYEGEWQASLTAILRATELSPEDQEGWWNLGIVATALGRWDLARGAWQRAGVKLPEGDGPIDFPCGEGPIRLNPAEAQTVWANRLDPARARLSSIPLGGYCFGDVVLSDGAPVEYRQEVPVYRCLALLEPSPLATWCVDITLEEPKRPAHVPGPLAQLDIIARERGMAAEARTTPERDLRVEPRRIAIAARTRGEVQDLLADWDAEGRGAVVGEIQMEFSHA